MDVCGGCVPYAALLGSNKPGSGSPSQIPVLDHQQESKKTDHKLASMVSLSSFFKFFLHYSFAYIYIYIVLRFFVLFCLFFQFTQHNIPQLHLLFQRQIKTKILKKYFYTVAQITLMYTGSQSVLILQRLSFISILDALTL